MHTFFGGLGKESTFSLATEILILLRMFGRALSLVQIFNIGLLVWFKFPHLQASDCCNQECIRRSVTFFLQLITPGQGWDT